jgi:hypothetical protein
MSDHRGSQKAASQEAAGGGSKQASSKKREASKQAFFSRESISTLEQDTTSVNGKIHWCLVYSSYSHIYYHSWTTSVEARQAE